MFKRTISFLAWRRYSFVLSGCVMVFALGVYFLRGGFNWGIDFVGGTQFHVDLNDGSSVVELRDLIDYDVAIDRVGDTQGSFLIKLKAFDLDNVSLKKRVRDLAQKTIIGPLRRQFPFLEVERENYGKDLLILFKSASGLSPDFSNSVNNLGIQKVDERYEFRAGLSDFLARNIVLYPLRKSFPGLEVLDRTLHEPVQGKQIQGQVFFVSVVVLFLVLCYVAVRFHFGFAVAAIIALLHDVLFVLACVLFVGVEFNISVVVGVLTIMGYSLNDTIVVFDRIRENRDRSFSGELSNIIDQSITQSLSRTIVTSLTTLFVIMSILLFGGTALWSLAITLFFGIIVGTYSSVFIASPLLFVWEGYFPSKEEGPTGKQDDRIVV